MTIKYQLGTEDYLLHQLYTSSKSELHKKRRNRSRLIIALSSIVFASFFFIQDHAIGGAVYLLCGFIGYILHPFYAAWQYKRHFKKHIDENLKNRIDVPIKLEITDTYLKLSDPESNSEISVTLLDKLIELTDHFFIKLSNNSTIILPKSALTNQQEFVTRISALDVTLSNETQWKWR